MWEAIAPIIFIFVFVGMIGIFILVSTHYEEFLKPVITILELKWKKYLQRFEDQE